MILSVRLLSLFVGPLSTVWVTVTRIYSLKSDYFGTNSSTKCPKKVSVKYDNVQVFSSGLHSLLGLFLLGPNERSTKVSGRGRLGRDVRLGLGSGVVDRELTC